MLLITLVFLSFATANASEEAFSVWFVANT